jgi:hypothetical protein
MPVWRFASEWSVPYLIRPPAARGVVIRVHGQGPTAMSYVNPADDLGNRRMSTRLYELIEHPEAESKRPKEPPLVLSDHSAALHQG